MELSFDIEPPEKRVLHWLSQTGMPASIRNSRENGNAASNVANPNENAIVKDVSIPADCSVEPLPMRLVRGESEHHKYFSSNKINDSECASSDSDCESLENSALYCNEERNSIIRNIIDKKLFPFLKGNTIWKQMERERICFRSWQSMKTQFEKYIFPHLDDFVISDTDKGYIVQGMAPRPVNRFAGRLLPGQRGWRRTSTFFSFLEDAIILYYILEKERYEFAYGNTLWQRMELKHIVTGRTWHSMKSRYKNFLSKYVERVQYVAKYGSKPEKKKLGPVEKTEIIQDFMVDHLSDVAATIGCISDSNERIEELKCLGLNSSLSIPLPDPNSNLSEREIIRRCVWDIARQLDEKFHMLLEYSKKSTKKRKEIMNEFSPKYPIITETFSLKDRPLSFSDQNYDLSESVQHGLKISTPSKYIRNIFQSSPKKSTNKPCTIVNPEISAYATPVRLHSSENIVLERIMHLTEKLQTGIKDFPDNTDASVRNFLLNNPQVSQDSLHFSNTLKKTSVISQNTVNTNNATTENFDCTKVGEEKTFDNSLQECYMTPDTIHSETRHQYEGKKMQQHNHNSSTSNPHVQENVSSANSLCSTQPDDLIKLLNLDPASADHLLRIAKMNNSKETNKPHVTLYRCSDPHNKIDISNVDLQLSSVTTQKKTPAPKIQAETNNAAHNVHKNSLVLETMLCETKYSEARKIVHSNDVKNFSDLLNIPQNILSKDSLNVSAHKTVNQGTQSDHMFYDQKSYSFKENNNLNSNRMLRSDSGNVCISSDSNNEPGSSSLVYINNVEQSSKACMTDVRCRLERTVPLNSSTSFSRKSQTNNHHAQSHDESEELKLHLTEEESEEEPELRLHLTEDESEEEPELRLHISEDDSEEEHQLRLHLLDDEHDKESSGSF